MAYERKTNETKWNAVKGMDGFKTIGTKERFSISFDATDDLHISVNGCRVVNGKNGEFISFPAWKDKSGNYHNYCYYNFNADEIRMIIASLV